MVNTWLDLSLRNGILHALCHTPTQAAPPPPYSCVRIWTKENVLQLSLLVDAFDNCFDPSSQLSGTTFMHQVDVKRPATHRLLSMPYPFALLTWPNADC